MVYVDYGASLLNKSVLDLVPANTRFSLEELFPLLIDQQELLAYEVQQRFYEIGSPPGLIEFKEFITKEVAI